MSFGKAHRFEVTVTVFVEATADDEAAPTATK
jgi:hypothetical protein